jgi:hypothetical protein
MDEEREALGHAARDEQMKMNFPAIVDREAKSQKGKDEKCKKRHVGKLCQKAKSWDYDRET